MCELRKRRRRGTYSAFLDVNKEDETVWSTTEVCKGVSEFVEGVEASIVLDGEQSRWFKVEKGLRQGCTLSPLLYSIYVMGIVEKLEEGSQGVKEDEEKCGTLLYADDIMLLAVNG